MAARTAVADDTDADHTDADMSDENQAAPSAESSAGEAESFGSWLRSQREVRQVELGLISQSSKINIRYLEALEQDRFDLLPATIFVRGFLREYARVVGLDPDEVLNFYMEASGRDDSEVGIENRKTRSARWSLVRTGMAVLLAAAILAFFVWRFSGADREAAEHMEAMAPPLTEEAPPPPTEPLPERALRVTLEFRAKSWVDVHSDGERTVSELRVQSESLTVTADEEIRLKLGNVDAAAIEVNGELFEHDAGDNEEIVIAAPWQPGAGA